MRRLVSLFFVTLFSTLSVVAIGQEAPPARVVVVAGVQERKVAPQVRFVGAVDYDRIAEVAPEVSGVMR